MTHVQVFHRFLGCLSASSSPGLTRDMIAVSVVVCGKPDLSNYKPESTIAALKAGFSCKGLPPCCEPNSLNAINWRCYVCAVVTRTMTQDALILRA